MDIGNDVTDYDARTYVRPAENWEYLEQMLESNWDWCSRWSVTPAAGYKNPLHQTQMRIKVIGKGRDSLAAEFTP